MVQQFLTSTVTIMFNRLWQGFLTAFVLRSYYIWFALVFTNKPLPIWPFWAAVLAIRLVVQQPQSHEDSELDKARYKKHGITQRATVNWAIYLVHTAMYYLMGLALAILKLNY